MKIALVVHDFTPDNGQGRYAIELARRLANRCEFIVFANTHEPVPNVRIQHVPALRRRYVFAIFTFLARVELLLRRHPDALIHAQGLSCARADIATVHICNAARAAALPRDQRGSHLFANLIMPLEARFYRQRRLRRLITMSHRLESEVRRHYGWRGPVSVIPHGTDGARFRPPADASERAALRRRHGLPAEGWVWLFVGEAVKGLAEAIRALPHFPEATLAILSRSRLDGHLAEASALGVRPRIRLVGFQPQPETLYRAADVLVHPTQYESFGMVVAEAMATGLPVIVGRDAGVAELIEDGRNGLLVPPADPDAVARQLARLAADPSLASRLGLAARATILEHSWDRCAEETWAAYEAVWADAHSAPARRAVPCPTPP